MLFVVFLIFFMKGFFVLDPDFGWHLKTGEYILKQGIPKTDPFSYTMPDYPFIDHEWLSNVFIALLYSVVGITGLAALFAAAGLVPFLFLKDKGERIFYPILIAGIMISFIGVRPQIFSWIFVSVLFYLLRQKTLTPAVFGLIVFFQTLWVNLHGGFFLGFVMCSLFFTVDSFQKKKISGAALFLATSVFAASLVNPYGVRIWVEVFRSLLDPGLRFSIIEWMPAPVFLNICYWLYTAVSISFFIYYRNKATLFEKIIYVLFFLAGFASIRNIPLWVVVSFPLLQQHTDCLYKQITKIDRFGVKRQRAKHLFVMVVFIAFLLQLFLSYYDGYIYTEERGYPKKAVEYIRKKGIKENIMAYYSWGGYLIWNLPLQKTFIDGRMPSWRWDGGAQDHSTNAYGEYKTALKGPTQLERVAKKYNVKYFLFPLSTAKTKDNLFTNLKIIYKDNTAVLYQEGW